MRQGWLFLHVCGLGSNDVRTRIANFCCILLWKITCSSSHQKFTLLSLPAWARGMNELSLMMDWAGWRAKGLECTKIFCLGLAGMCRCKLPAGGSTGSPRDTCRQLGSCERTETWLCWGIYFAMHIESKHQLNEECKLCNALSWPAKHPGGVDGICMVEWGFSTDFITVYFRQLLSIKLSRNLLVSH